MTHHHDMWQPTADQLWEVKTTTRHLTDDHRPHGLYMAVVAREKGTPGFAPAFVHGPYADADTALAAAPAAINAWMTYYAKVSQIPEPEPVTE
ncbi:hypothetical protein [Rhodanobacter thiooxydans]|uniref:hypothetical protein n=1 Tax=Rhodanobacter thiooxydans TaxID=416169 RepID=UPI000B33F71B|nr:hypothetical protein [Rhodanobacter thiooxydans]UJJ56774.1 hypothetical protein LRK53_18335 [Rhodanobacter thiooxydans]